MSIPHSSLLGIPLELRHQIYALCFNKWVAYDPRYRRAIASVCHQTRSEALPMLLKECRCITLEKFRTWTAKGNPDLLLEITDIFLLDYKISALRYAAKGPYSSLTSNDDISAITRQIFSSIPNLRHARFNLISDDLGPIPGQTGPQGRFLQTIIACCPANLRSVLQKPKSNLGQLPGQTDFQETFLRTIATCCPKFAELDLISDLLHVSALQGFRNLHSLEWSGLSPSTPQETLAVLNSLPYLHTIKLTRWPEFYDREKYSVPTAELHAYVSFTSHVLQNLKPLRQFRIRHAAPHLASDFVTTEMVKALAAHRESLIHLGLRSSHPVEGAVLGQLLYLLPLLTLERLRISFTSIPRQYNGIRPEELVGPSVKFCHISLKFREGEEEVTLEHHLRCGNGCAQKMV